MNAAPHEKDAAGRGPPIAIRPAAPSDVPQLTVLAAQLGYPATEEEVQQRLLAILLEENDALWVAEIPDGSVVGWVHVHLGQVLVEPARAMVWGLVVDEAYRSRGIGELLMRQVEQWARERGCWAVSVNSNVVRERAHAFYQRLGYSHTKTQKVLRKVL